MRPAILYPEAKVTIVTELVNQEVILLTTKMSLVLAMKLLFNCLIDRTSPYGRGFGPHRCCGCASEDWTYVRRQRRLRRYTVFIPIVAAHQIRAALK